MKNKKFLLLAIGFLATSCGTAGNIEEPQQPVVSENGESVRLELDKRVRREGEGSPETISIYGKTLELNNSIDVIYVVDNEYEESISTGLLIWQNAPAEYTYDSADYKLTSSGKYSSTEYDEYKFKGVSAKEMTDYFYAVAYVEDADGMHYSAPSKYSVLTYCYNKINAAKGSEDEDVLSLANLCESILDYGAASQTYFKYKTDRLANAEYTKITISGGTLADGFTSGLFLENETINLPKGNWRTTTKNFYKKSSISISELGGETVIFKLEDSVGLDIVDGVLKGIGTCTDSVIVIPESVTSIGNNCFSNKTQIIGVVMPDTITKIGSNVFYYCTNLSFALLSDSLSLIGSSAFYYCTSLSSVTIPNGVTKIGYQLFEYCRSLSSISIPQSVTSIDSNAFDGCTSLSSVTIPEGVTSIGNYAFQSCSSLTSVTIPSSVTSIGGYAFSNCTRLSSLTISEGVTSIASVAFRDCTSLKTIHIPSSVTSIASGAFFGCKNITSISVDEGNEAFDSRNGCNALIRTSTNELIVGCCNTTIPSGVTSIGNSAFYNCASLSSVTIPSSVTSIGSSSFSGCTSLSSVTIPSSVTSIGQEAFNACTSLSSLTISEGVISIGTSAFKYCTSLSSVTIPSSVTSISNNAFEYCWALSSLTISEGVISIGESAFNVCGLLVSVAIPSSVTSIGNYAFNSCTSLETVYISASVTSIGKSAFTSLKSGATIYCESSSKPDGWNALWTNTNSEGEYTYNVLWGQTMSQD